MLHVIDISASCHNWTWTAELWGTCKCSGIVSSGASLLCYMITSRIAEINDQLITW